MIKKSITDIDVAGKKVLVRCDFNVPVRDDVILNSARIMASLKTIQYLINHKAKVILMSHFGRPKGIPNNKYSLEFVAKYLGATIGKPVLFADDDDVVGEQTKFLVKLMKDGDVLLLQNTRFREEEEKNDLKFSKEIASLGDIFVNDAFGTAHRSHSSIVGITKFIPSCIGFLLKEEIDILNLTLNNTKKPFVLILGGAKISDKIKIINNLLSKIEILIIGGGMAFTFYAALGIEIGKSFIEKNKIIYAKNILEKAKKTKTKILLPEDIVVSNIFSNDSEFEIVNKNNIKKDMMGLDIGPKSVKFFQNIISDAGTVFWNGPMGVFEMSNFSKGTFGIAQAMSETEATTIVGGGDSAAAVDLSSLAHKMTHISTGGGALLEFLEKKTLPGIEVIEDQLRGKLICGNWKMNTTIQEGIAIVKMLINKVKNQKVKIVICPPFTHLEHFKQLVSNSFVKIGAQNVHEKDAGAFTGEISAQMLADLKMNYCIIGHSERRQYYGETDEKISLKARKLLKYGIHPIICFGESIKIKKAGETKKFIKKQIKKSFNDIPINLGKEIIVAYEPIWSIGTGLTPDLNEINKICYFIRKQLKELGYLSEKMLIIYGGSVTSINSKMLLSCTNVDGALIGGASLKVQEFLDIIENTK